MQRVSDKQATTRGLVADEIDLVCHTTNCVVKAMENKQALIYNCKMSFTYQERKQDCGINGTAVFFFFFPGCFVQVAFSTVSSPHP